MRRFASKRMVGLVAGLLFASITFAQQKTEKKYPSLLWEITSNGLKKPSYLFGTMHISSKMVFHLSDSFFMAIKNSDVVGLELNSETWQQEMVEIEKQKNSFYQFYSGGYNYNDYDETRRYGSNTLSGSINENSFRMEGNYIPILKYALQETPYVINSLLYRSYDYKQDFEEDTFLDMYIYQTGKKLGKKSAGMETLYTMEKYVTEAQIDKANEKKKKYKPRNYDNMPEMTADEAYRKGDLDMLDSIDRMYNESEAFIEKFLYQRNDVQANSMDTIMKKGQSLFVGVGAAHLPGKRGVIEILRRMGYKLRPIKMLDRDAAQRDKIDKIRVPVQFIDNNAADNLFKVKVPGKLYNRQDGIPGMSMQYADMSNGAYYMVTRVPTLAPYFYQSAEKVYKTVDSLLYENIPGKIVQKTPITRNGYLGMDVTNKTRRGDIQRYNIFITPYEVLIFKMSGIDNYVTVGNEATTFFNSIVLKNEFAKSEDQVVKMGNVQFQLPTQQYKNDFFGIPIALGYDANKKINYLYRRMDLSRYDFSPPDTFNVMLMEESFMGKKKDFTTISRVYDTTQSYTCMNAVYKVADTTFSVKYAVNGNSCMLLAATGTDGKAVLANTVLPSFKLNYTQPQKKVFYTDTFLKFSVQTPVQPVIVDSLKQLLFKLANNNKYYRYGSSSNEPAYVYKDIDREMQFVNDSTGEKIQVSIEKSGRYEFWHDSLYQRKLFRDSLEKAFKNPTKLANYIDSFYAVKYPIIYGDNITKKYIVKQNELERVNGEFSYLKQAYTDTGSTKLIRRMEISKGDVNYIVSTETDTTNSSPFINTFFATFKPLPEALTFSNKYGSRVDSFFADYYAKDTTSRKIARSAINSYNFDKKDMPKMMQAFKAANIKEKDYFDVKLKWIRAITSLADSTNNETVLNFIKKEYEKTADTTIFQNAFLAVLVNMETTASYQLFKQYLLQDPPILQSSYNSYDYSYNDDGIEFFNNMDSLALVKTLFPEILQLTTIPDYEDEVINLLEKLVDSNKISAKEYEGYSGKLLFDAKLLWKKQLANDQKQMQNDLEAEATEDDEVGIKEAAAAVARTLNSSDYNYAIKAGNIMRYIKLLLPFYETNSSIPTFIQKLWSTKDEGLKYNLLLKMIAEKKPYPDTLINYFIAKEVNRGDMYYKLSKLKMIHLFPKKYVVQDTMARAFFYTSISYIDAIDSIDLITLNSETSKSWTSYPPLSGLGNYDYGSANSTTVSTQLHSLEFIKKDTLTVNKKKGLIYIYKYKKEKEDKWRFAYSGLQPLDGTSISYKNYITALTEEKLNEDEPLASQIALLLKKLQFKMNPWSSDFFVEQSRYGGYNRY